ncbi:MAG: carboxy terminal-processing peptidase [Opitutales bacterium]|jgi:carboxyl-terminal processing protease|nr:carboxy terminal-processing peptidase [Verrucomicrobiota bacterium]
MIYIHLKACFLLFFYIAGSSFAIAIDPPVFSSQAINSKQSYSAQPTPLVPSPIMVDETKWLLNALEKAHYKKLSIEDLNEKLFLENYLKNLDKQKLFFTAQDLEEFILRYEPTLLTYLKQGNLFPAFEIYDSYRKNALSRLNQSINLLSGIPKLDNNQSYQVDRSDSEWAHTIQHLDDVWKKLISYEFTNELLTQVDDNETSLELTQFTQRKRLDALEKIKKKYERWHKNITEFEASDVQELYLSTLTQMFDPHTSFLNIKEKEKFDQAMHNEFVGIGAVLTDEDGYCTIKELLPGGPAEASRELEAEDVILQVAQEGGEFVDVVEMKLSKIVDLIKGPKDTIVSLKIRPIKSPSSTKVVKIVRDKIKLTANLASASVYNIENDRDNLAFGVIELPSFYGSSGEGHKATDDVEELIEVLKEEAIQGLILDLRRNGGGYLSEAVNLAGLFISRGPVVQVKSSDGKIRKKFDFNPKLAWDGPLIILVSRYSASASEIVAGALKNHRRAIIVGDKSTHGKGTVQSLIPMNLPFSMGVQDGKRSAAKITIQKYYLPSGESTQLTGVTSDISMHSINEYLPIGESDLDNALAWDKIPEVNFRRPEGEFKYNEVEINLLRRLSEKRQQQEKEFQYLEKSISWFKEKREQKVVPLSLSQRLNEKAIDSNRSQILSDEFDSLKMLSFPSREIVLQVVKDQKEKSMAIRGLSNDEQNSTKDKYTQSDTLDIRLHESLRILRDWVNETSYKQISHKIDSGKSEI